MGEPGAGLLLPTPGLVVHEERQNCRCYHEQECDAGQSQHDTPRYQYNEGLHFAPPQCLVLKNYYTTHLLL